ncbi:unnamed protein product [Paramecium pentaurelia]|uniref:Uncharacterized protein n=1 Tax=Paramecium pentaurelia TaxID=43138 RepID=A0A8S1WAN2_9CILI|nr:unnamed protein product [Paramecium pentaurelia]
MSLIYVVIVRENNITLVDYESVTSNFPSLAKKLFDKLKKNTRQTFVYDQNYHFHYINENDFTYLCLADAYLSKATAFAFLEEIKESFCQKFSENLRKQAINYGMQQQFVEYLKDKMFYYNNDPENEKIVRLKNQLTDVANQMSLTLDQILDREDQVQILVHSTQTMNKYADTMKTTATQVRKDQESRVLRTRLFIAAVIVTMFLVIYLLY